MAKRNQDKVEKISREKQLELMIKKLEENPQTAYELFSLGYARNHLEELKEQLQKEREEREAIRLREDELYKDTPLGLFRKAYSQDDVENE